MLKSHIWHSVLWTFIELLLVYKRSNLNACFSFILSVCVSSHVAVARCSLYCSSCYNSNVYLACPDQSRHLLTKPEKQTA